MAEHAPEIVTIVERTINSQKVLAWACGDEAAGDAEVERAELQDAHWGLSSIDRIHVIRLSQLPEDSLFRVPRGGISNAGRFEYMQLLAVANVMHLSSD